jgi:acetyl-CoA carboxylase beta subunit
LKFKGKSKFEIRLGRELTEMGEKFSYEKEKWQYKLKPYNAKCSKCGSCEVYETRIYTPDFFLSSGIVVEAKGHLTSKMRTKLKAVIASNPDKDLRIVFMQDNFLTKSRKKTYSKWCEQQGIKYSIGSIPKEWTKCQE